MLKECVALKPKKLILREYTDDPVPEGHIRVRVEYGAPKHGTELHLFRGDDPHLANRFDKEYRLFVEDANVKAKPYFMAIGNMWVGIVIELGTDVSNVKVGMRVAGYGGLRNTQTVKAEDVLLMNDSMTWKEALCYDPCHFALAGVRDGHVKIGDRVAVFGMGAIGLMTAQLAKLSGASFVVIADPIEKRRKAALDNGADAAIDPMNSDAGLEIKKITGGKGVDVAIETSASYNALQHAVRGVAYGGNVAVVGWYGECKGGLNLGREAHFNQPNLIFSRACSEPNRNYPNWNFSRITSTCWDILSKGLINCEKIVDPVVSFEDAPAAYMDIDEHPEKSVKLGINFGR